MAVSAALARYIIDVLTSALTGTPVGIAPPPGVAPGPPAPVVISSSSFTAPSGTTLAAYVGEVGATWTKHPQATSDAFVNVNGMVRNNTLGNAIYTVSGEPLTPDYWAECDLVYKSSVCNAGPSVRVDPTLDTMYLARLRSVGAELILRQNGVETVLATSAFTPVVNRTYHLLVKAVGTTITMELDSVQILQVTNNVITSRGLAGFRNRYSSTPGDESSGGHFDTFGAGEMRSTSGAAAVLASIRVSPTAPAAPTITVGDTQTLVATAFDQTGAAMTSPVYTWTTSASGVATVNASGAVTAVAAGTATITATSGAISGTCVVTIQAAPSAGSSIATESYQPAGLTRFAETAFTTLPGSGSNWTNTGMLLGECSRLAGGIAHSFGSDSGALLSAPAVLVTTYKAGDGDGSGKSPIDFWAKDRSLNSLGFASKNELFYIFGLYIPDTYGDGLYQNQGTGTKLFYTAYANTVRQNHSFAVLNGNGQGASTQPNGVLQSAMSLRWYISEMELDTDPASATYNQYIDPGHSNQRAANVDTTKKIQVGTRHRIALYMKRNTGDVADGLAQMWIDGVKIHDHNNVRWTSLLNNKGFYNLRYEPIWGGDTGQVRTRTEYFLVDHLYVAGA
jgi:hypothetical protein